MRRQVRLAGEVQRRMIPEPAARGGLDLAAVYVPSLDLSGDFYDFIELPAGNLGVVICDVMGKGVPASLLMASIRASLRAHVSNLYDLSEVLRRVNRSLCDDTLISSFATLFYGVINTRIRQLTYSNAGHEPPMLVREGKVQRLSTGGTVLGIERDMRYNQEVVQLQAARRAGAGHRRGVRGDGLQGRGLRPGADGGGHDDRHPARRRRQRHRQAHPVGAAPVYRLASSYG